MSEIIVFQCHGAYPEKPLAQPVEVTANTKKGCLENKNDK
jgi:hypothetical protein